MIIKGSKDVIVGMLDYITELLNGDYKMTLLMRNVHTGEITPISNDDQVSMVRGDSAEDLAVNMAMEELDVDEMARN